MLKVVLDNIRPLQPYGYLLGDEEQPAKVHTNPEKGFLFPFGKRQKKS
jgi:hypothetical protein